jgi:hypothetical protein
MERTVFTLKQIERGDFANERKTILLRIISGYICAFSESCDQAIRIKTEAIMMCFSIVLIRYEEKKAGTPKRHLPFF